MISGKFKLIIWGIVAGALGGYLYYYFVGCTGDSCRILSSPFTSTLYGGFLGGWVFSLFKNNSKNKMKITQLIKENKGTIIDVRTPHEFRSAHAPGSINIPLQELPGRMDEIKSMKGPIILCCASGSRSGQAGNFLARQGVECYNAGSWIDVNFNKS